MPSWGRLYLFLISLLAIAIYWHGLFGNFFFDDEANILHVEVLHLNEISRASLRDVLSSGIAGPSGRPVAQLSFALNYYLDGSTPFDFKATNLAIHLLTAWAGYLVLQQLQGKGIYPLVGTALWLIHPIQVTSVLYVVQRMTSLSALFLLAGFALHMIGRQQQGIKRLLLLMLAWGICWPLSFFSKETGALFPLFVVAWELIVRRNSHCGLDKFARALISVIALGSVAGAVYAFSANGQWVWAGYGMREFSPVERLLTESRVLWFYLSLIVLPRFAAYGLYHDDIELSTDLLTPWITLPAMLGVAGLIWITWHYRKRAPLVAFGLAWFFIGHLLESTVVPLEIAHEHRNYLPSFGLVIVMVSGLSRVYAHVGFARTFSITLTISMVLYLSFLTMLRSHLYADDVRRTQIETQHHPKSVRSHYEAARVLLARLEVNSTSDISYALVSGHLETASKIDPHFKPVWLGLIHLGCITHQTFENEWLNRLENSLLTKPISPGDRNLLRAIAEMSIAGTLCISRQDIERIYAAVDANKAATKTVTAAAHAAFADYLTLVAHDYSAAEEKLNKAVASMPGKPKYQLRLAELAFLQGRRDEARLILEKILTSKLNVSEKAFMLMLGDCLASDPYSQKCVLPTEGHQRESNYH